MYPPPPPPNQKQRRAIPVHMWWRSCPPRPPLRPAHAPALAGTGWCSDTWYEGRLSRGRTTCTCTPSLGGETNTRFNPIWTEPLTGAWLLSTTAHIDRQLLSQVLPPPSPLCAQQHSKIPCIWPSITLPKAYVMRRYLCAQQHSKIPCTWPSITLPKAYVMRRYLCAQQHSKIPCTWPSITLPKAYVMRRYLCAQQRSKIPCTWPSITLPKAYVMRRYLCAQTLSIIQKKMLTINTSETSANRYETDRRTQTYFCGQHGLPDYQHCRVLRNRGPHSESLLPPQPKLHEAWRIHAWQTRMTIPPTSLKYNLWSIINKFTI